MSIQRTETIICPKCQAKGKFTIWDSMNVTLDSELRKKVFSTEAFIYTCPNCGHRLGIPYGTLYHDLTHHFMLFFQFFPPDDYDNQSVDIPRLPGSDNYIYRHVIGLDNLKEKICIFENGLNDIAIERLKYMYTHVVHPEMAKSNIKLLFEDVNYDDKQFSDRGTMSFFFFNEKDEAMQLSVSMEMYFEHCLACELDTRMNVKGCLNVDAGWIAKQLKKTT